MAGPVLGGKVWFPKSFRFYQQVRKGYIVLLPEVNPEHLDTNPLFKAGLPDLDNLTAEKCSTTFGKYILDFEHAVREVEKKVQAPDKDKPLDIFDEVVDPIEEAGAQLESTWGLLKALYTVDNTIMPQETYIPLHDRARRARGSKFASRHIYNAFKSCDTSKLTEEEQRVIAKFRLEGKLNGIELGMDGSELFTRTSVDLAKERDTFTNKVRNTSTKYSHVITDSIITREFPEDLLKSISINRSGSELEGPWRVNLSHLNRFLKFCPDRKLRWNIWLASRQVASPEYDSTMNNSSTIEAIRKLRRDIANILGYISYAHMSMETKMAGSLVKVQKTLDTILSKARDLQGEEISDLQNFAEERGFRGRLELWDVPFWERRQKFELFNWDERNLREYFPYEKVMAGLMDICSERCGLRFEVAKAKTWHPDVKLYNIYDQESTRPIAGIYIDPFKRPNKLATPGQVVCIRPSARVLGPSTPLSAFILSLPPPTSDLPCLVNFEDVEMIFKKFSSEVRLRAIAASIAGEDCMGDKELPLSQRIRVAMEFAMERSETSRNEFGQVLQQLLSTVNYMEVSGLSYIEWDAVEVVSNVMSLWLNDPEVLAKVSGHYKTGEPLPIKGSLEDVRRHLSGYQMCTEVYKANLDIQLHNSTEFWLKIVKSLWPEHYIFDLDPNDHHLCSFMQPFAGEFGAAYFSHIWAKMLAEDAYSAFQNEEDKKAIGLRFRDTFLSFGGACQPNEVFRRFQGRDPSVEGLINSLGKKVP